MPSESELVARYARRKGVLCERCYFSDEERRHRSCGTVYSETMSGHVWCLCHHEWRWRDAFCSDWTM